MLSEKVVPIRSNEVYEQIEKWLQKKGYRSKNTRISYEGDIKRFFRLMRGKEIHLLGEKDIQVTIDDLEEFIAILKDGDKLNNKTINRNVTAVRELLKYLKTKKLVDNVENLLLVELLPIKKNKYGILKHEEVLALSDFALSEREKPITKHKLIQFAYDTCIRLDAILNIKWTDFEKVENEEFKINGVDKGNKEITARIKEWFYEDLVKTLKNDTSEYVFDISEDSVNKLMKRFREKNNIKKERKIVFHSIRKAGAMHIWNLTHDILFVQKILNHSSPTITQDYLEVGSYGAVGAISILKDVNENAYKFVSYEDLIVAIEEMSLSTKLLISLKLKEINSNK